ncbi:MAG: hypothetical protein ACPL3C_09625, partial [Pyrobaculum sp.]
LTPFSTRLYVELYLDNDRIAYGTVIGGYRYGYLMKIVEPVYEGRSYTLTVYVYDANTRRYLGYGSYSYIEKYCPDIEIVSVDWDKFIYTKTSTVTITLRNNGEASWTYTVEVYSRGGSLRKVSREVTVGAGSTATVKLQVPVEKYERDDVMYVRAYCAGGKKSVERTYSISITPPRPGPFEASINTIELRLGVEGRFTITAINKGFDAEVVSLTLSEGRYSINAPRRVSEGGTATFTIRFTPERAGVYKIKATLRYKSPATGEEYEDVFTIPLKVYAQLRVEAVDHTGRPLDITPVISGEAVRERWLLPGTYTIEVPQIVTLGADARAVFERWEGATGGNTGTVVLRENTVIRAIYSRQYRVAVILAPAGTNYDTWVRAGDVYSPPISRYVTVGEGARWALKDVVINGVSQGATERPQIRINGPTEIKAVWAKEYHITVDCGEVRCIDGQNRVERWVEEGSVAQFRLDQIVPAGERVRWRLDGNPVVEIKATEPYTVRPRYIKQYLLRIGYIVKTAQGEAERRAVREEWVDTGSQYTVDISLFKPVEAQGIRYMNTGLVVDGASAPATFTVTAPHDVYIVWNKEYLVEVETPIGSASGGGWYLAGSYATVSIDQPVRGFL